MAVEAGHLSLFPPQLLGNKQIFMMNAIDHQRNPNPNPNPNPYGIPHPLSGTTTATAEHLLPMYGSGNGNFTDSLNPAAASIKSDSGLTYSLPVSRKRSRDSSSIINPLLSFGNAQNENQNAALTFLGQDISMQMQMQIQQQQLEIDQFIAHHTEKVRADIQERRKRNSRRIIAAVEEGITKRLREKEEEIVKIARLNWALEEKIKTLCVENQIWRELALTNEATANALRSNLKQVLEQVVQDDYRHRSTAACVEDDAESCCESNNEEHDNGKTVQKRWCKNCSKEESSVLLLPCRHLCLCTVCASSVNICPLCKSTKNISVHVNMS